LEGILLSVGVIDGRREGPLDGIKVSVGLDVVGNAVGTFGATPSKHPETTRENFCLVTKLFTFTKTVTTSSGRTCSLTRLALFLVSWVDNPLG